MFKFTKAIYIFLLSFLILICFMGCIILEEDDMEKYIINSSDYEYNLKKPNNNFKLPKYLMEISGLSYWKEHILLCIEDETGHLYLFDHVEDTVKRKIKFGKKGDYEGVANSNDMAYVIRSDGRLYHFEIVDEPTVTKVQLPFTSKNDLEGITLGHKKGEFYIVCKGSPKLFDNDLDGRAVYQYNVKKDKIKPNPYIHLTTEEFEKAIRSAGLKPSVHMPFMPSGIAIHPSSGDVFLMSSVGQLLVVLNQSGQIISMAPLKRSLFRQPEGICFDEKGNLFISSEGRGKKGYILKFENQLTGQ